MKNAEPQESGPKLGRLQTVAFLPLIVFFLFALTTPVLINNPRMPPSVQEREIDFSFNALVEVIDGAPYPDYVIPLAIHADGTVSVEGVLAEVASSQDLPALRRFLEEKRPLLTQQMAWGRSGGVLIQPHSSITYQRLIDVLSALVHSRVNYTLN